MYVGHTGRLTWIERAWAALLWAEPAGLWLDSAMRAHHKRSLDVVDASPIQLIVDRDRRLSPEPGVVIRRTAQFERRNCAGLAPPRVAFAHTVLDLAEAAASDLDAIGVLADACGSRRTTADDPPRSSESGATALAVRRPHRRGIGHLLGA